MIDIFVSFFITIFGFLTILISQRRNSKKRIKTLSLLWIFHLMMSIVFYFYALSNSSDSTGYWRISKESDFSQILLYLKFGPGTKFMYVLNYIPANKLNLSFFTGFILYSFIGFLGFVLLYDIIKKNLSSNPKIYGISLFPSILFLPNMHFWSSSIGKDTLLFFSILLIFYGIQKAKRTSIFAISFGFILTFLIRPHIAALLAGSFTIAIVFSSKIKFIYKLFISLLGLIFLFSFMDVLMDFLSLQDLSVESILKRSERQVENLQGERSGSSVDVNNYPIPIKIFTFLYRPLFFDSPNALGYIVSIENFILLILSLVTIRNKAIRGYKKAPLIIRGVLIFLLLGTIMLSMSLGNLGIMIRMKNMFMPALILFVLWCISYRKYERDIWNWRRNK